MNKVKSFLVLSALIVSIGTAVVAPEVKELKDGTQIEVDGDKVFVLGKDGAKTPAPDGTHTLKDGSTVTTKGGVVAK